MPKYSINTYEDINNIAEAIKTKLGTDQDITVSQMPEAIASISGGGSGGSSSGVRTVNISAIIYDRDYDFPMIPALKFQEIVESYAAGYRVQVTFLDDNNEICCPADWVAQEYWDEDVGAYRTRSLTYEVFQIVDNYQDEVAEYIDLNGIVLVLYAPESMTHFDINDMTQYGGCPYYTEGKFLVFAKAGEYNFSSNY